MASEKLEIDERARREGASGRGIRDALEDLYFGFFDLVNKLPPGDLCDEAEKVRQRLEVAFVDALYSLRHYEEELEKTRDALEAATAKLKAMAPKEGG